MNNGVVLETGDGRIGFRRGFVASGDIIVRDSAHLHDTRIAHGFAAPQRSSFDASRSRGHAHDDAASVTPSHEPARSALSGSVRDAIRPGRTGWKGGAIRTCAVCRAIVCTCDKLGTPLKIARKPRVPTALRRKPLTTETLEHHTRQQEKAAVAAATNSMSLQPHRPARPRDASRSHSAAHPSAERRASGAEASPRSRSHHLVERQTLVSHRSSLDHQPRPDIARPSLEELAASAELADEDWSARLGAGASFQTLTALSAPGAARPPVGFVPMTFSEPDDGDGPVGPNGGALRCSGLDVRAAEMSEPSATQVSLDTAEQRLLRQVAELIARQRVMESQLAAATARIEVLAHTDEAAAEVLVAPPAHIPNSTELALAASTAQTTAHDDNAAAASVAHVTRALAAAAAAAAAGSSRAVGAASIDSDIPLHPALLPKVAKATRKAADESQGAWGTGGWLARSMATVATVMLFPTRCCQPLDSDNDEPPSPAVPVPKATGVGNDVDLPPLVAPSMRSAAVPSPAEFPPANIDGTM